MQRYLLCVAINPDHEGLALTHYDVLLGKQIRQETWNHHSVEHRARTADPIDLTPNSLSCIWQNAKLEPEDVMVQTCSNQP